MSDTKIIKVRKIKEEKKHIIRIKKRDDTVHRLKVMSFKKFYDEYMKEVDQRPDDYIKAMTLKVLECYYHLKCEFENDKMKVKEIKRILGTFNYNDYLGIYDSCSYSKLKHMGIQDIMTNGIRRLYEVLQYLICIQGVKIDVKYDLDQIRHNLHCNSLDRVAGSKKILRRMFVIKDGNIIETGDNIEPNKILKGSTIMVEYNTNLYISIPYLFYKKLYQIEEFELKYIVYDKSSETDNYDDEENIFEVIRNTNRSNISNGGDVGLIFAIMDNFFEINAGLTELGWCDSGCYWFSVSNKIKLKFRDGTVEETDYCAFKRQYLQFLDWE